MSKRTRVSNDNEAPKIANPDPEHKTHLNRLLLCVASNTNYETMDEGNSLESVKYLVDMGADVNATNLNGDTALHLAVFHRPDDLSLIKYLLDSMSDVNAGNRDGDTPLMRAVLRFSDRECVDPDDYDSMEFLLDRGDIKRNCQDKRGNTALHYAVQLGNKGLVDLLLGNDADPFLENWEQDTPLEKCPVGKSASIEQLEIAEILIDAMKKKKEEEEENKDQE